MIEYTTIIIDMSTLEDAIFQLERVRLRHKMEKLQLKLNQLRLIKPIQRDQEADRKKKINIEFVFRLYDLVKIEHLYANTLDMAGKLAADHLNTLIQDAHKSRHDMSVKTLQALSNYLSTLRLE